jgi:predicted nucleic acid-binding Zn finger protein
LALSRHIYRLQNTDNTYYVESETRDDQYYFCKFKPEVLELSRGYCSCKDNSTRRGLKCKHLWGIEFAIKLGTIKEIDNPLTNVKRDTAIIKTTTIRKPMITSNSSLSYEDDEYTF